MKTYSFDIFDTCLVRTCGDARFVFDVLATQVLPDADTSLHMDFALERLKAERQARKKYLTSGKEDVTIEEIYSCFNCSDFLDEFTPDFLAEKEIEVESALLSPVRSIRDYITKLREEGYQILFISDMYLPHSMICKKLIETGFFKDGDKLYVSCEVGKSKATGNLFKHIGQELGLNNKYWTHCGDNRQSDYNIPKSLGIKAKLIEHSYSYFENKMRELDLTSREMPAHIMAGISRSVRLETKDTIHNKFASDFVAPIYVPFVYHILKDAEYRGIVDLYFLARDAYLFYEIAKIFQTKFPTVKLHYIYVSRSSLYLPGLKDISEDSILSLFSDIDWQSTESILTRLHMDEYEPSVDLVGKYGAKEIVPKLLLDKRFSFVLERKRKEQHDLCLKYFSENGLGGGNSSAIVDLTGTRRCPKAINNILKSGGLQPVFGYYFEVLPQRSSGKDYYALNYAERYSLNPKTYCVAPHDVFEQYYSITNQKRTREYKQITNGVEPVFETDVVKDDYKEKILSSNLNVCRKFAEAYLYLLRNADSEKCSEMATAISTDFFLYPKKDYLQALEELVLSDSSVEQRKLLTKQSVLKTIKERATSPWFYGNLIYNSKIPYFWRWILKIINNKK